MPGGNYIADGIGWEGGERVRVVEPADEEAPATNDGLLRVLILGTPDAATFYRRGLCIGYILKVPGYPATTEDLGVALGISRQAAEKWLRRFEATLPEIAREIGSGGCVPSPFIE